jgi:hypothetical protein
MKLRLMTSSTKTLVGLVSGMFVGFFFGKHASVLKAAADGFVKLLQMMVLPYITISIIALPEIHRGRAGTMDREDTAGLCRSPARSKLGAVYDHLGRAKAQRRYH